MLLDVLGFWHGAQSILLKPAPQLQPSARVCRVHIWLQSTWFIFCNYTLVFLVSKMMLQVMLFPRPISVAVCHGVLVEQQDKGNLFNNTRMFLWKSSSCLSELNASHQWVVWITEL